MKRCIASSLSPLILALMAASTRAADLQPVGADGQPVDADGSEFREEYAGGANVGGSLLAAFAYATDDRPLDLQSVRLDFRPESNNDGVCVQMTTSDGRYWALNDYRSSDGQVALTNGSLDEAPPSLAIPTNYDEHLRGYKSTDFLILARTKSCDPETDKEETDKAGTDVVYIPARIASGDKPEWLNAYVNINRGTVTARIEAGGETVVTGNCRRTKGAGHAAYSRICAIPTKGLGSDEPYTLVLIIVSLTGQTTERRYNFVVW